MKLHHVVVAMIIGLILLGFSFSLGHTKAEQDCKKPYIIQSEIAIRYMKYIGNPATFKEQCLFENIIYGYCDFEEIELD